MGWDGIADLIGTVAKWWTPEKVKARARSQLNKLKGEEREILDKPSSSKNSARLIAVRRNIARLQSYLANN